LILEYSSGPEKLPVLSRNGPCRPEIEFQDFPGKKLKIQDSAFIIFTFLEFSGKMRSFQYSAGIILKIHDSAGMILNFNILLLKYGISNILPPCIHVFCWHNLEIQYFACKTDVILPA